MTESRPGGVEIFDPTESRNYSRAYRRQYESTRASRDNPTLVQFVHRTLSWQEPAVAGAPEATGFSETTPLFRCPRPVRRVRGRRRPRVADCRRDDCPGRRRPDGLDLTVRGRRCHSRSDTVESSSFHRLMLPVLMPNWAATSAWDMDGASPCRSAKCRETAAATGVLQPRASKVS